VLDGDAHHAGGLAVETFDHRGQMPSQTKVVPPNTGVPVQDAAAAQPQELP
jgi:hypothetical protein